MIITPSLHPLSSTRFDPITDVLTILAIAGAGFGAAELFNSTSNQPKTPDNQPLPNQKVAQQTAQDQTNAQRKLLLASGGQTDYTGGSAVIGSGDVNKTVLLGN